MDEVLAQAGRTPWDVLNLIPPINPASTEALHSTNLDQNHPQTGGIYRWQGLQG